eukprot:jgi/Mesvir1/11973/Mv00292-RA.1
MASSISLARAATVAQSVGAVSASTRASASSTRPNQKSAAVPSFNSSLRTNVSGSASSAFVARAASLASEPSVAPRKTALTTQCLHKATNTVTLTGYVTAVDVGNAAFKVVVRSGDEFICHLSSQTWCKTLKNLDELDTDRMPNPPGFDWSPSARTAKYINVGALLIVAGIEMVDGPKTRIDARTIHVMENGRGGLIFEDPKWWINQIFVLAQVWCNVVGEDFRKNYRTNLDIAGNPTDDTSQEMATLSRLIYGLSSAYLLTGNDRFLRAARDGVKFQRESFRLLSSNGQFCFWAYGLVHGKMVVPSQNGDDMGQIPLYEQIYALAGLTQYYRITYDPDALADIVRTVNMFDKYYLDTSGKRGYYSHVDASSLLPDDPALGDNCAQKNWNSIGDHIPAYLINLICALEPVPAGTSPMLDEFLTKCKWILRETSELILTKFPDPDPKMPYVNERFHEDWSPWTDWRWQQDSAVCGHNLKIAWNLTRAANYYSVIDKSYSDSLMSLCCYLGDELGKLGVDQVRSGLFDVVERKPTNGMWLEFRWWDTKDFWQQEQAILAYYILYGKTKNEEYLKLAREQTAFYNTFFLNHDDAGIYFRTNGDGLPFLVGSYRQKGGHSISGYHAFELCFLADIYTKCYVTKENLCMYFKPTDDPRAGQTAINVLPDFIEPGTLKIVRININGTDRPIHDPYSMVVQLDKEDLGPDTDVIVEYEPQPFEAYTNKSVVKPFTRGAAISSPASSSGKYSWSL